MQAMCVLENCQQCEICVSAEGERKSGAGIGGRGGGGGRMEVNKMFQVSVLKPRAYMIGVA